MSLWICAKHGLYGGQIDCPQCGRIGSYATFEKPEKDRNPASNGSPREIFLCFAGVLVMAAALVALVGHYYSWW